MNQFRKAQTATEYIILLSIVLIIALIVVTVIGGIPAIGGTARFRTSSTYWQSADMGIVAYSFDGDALGTDDVMVLRNNYEEPITITSIGLDGDQVYSGSTPLTPGEQQSVSVDYDCGGAAGDRYSFEVEINYTVDETGNSYSFNGEGHSLVGRCSR